MTMMHTPATDLPPARTRNRWLIAGMGAMLQLCLGTVYAYTIFQDPFVKSYQWTNTQVSGAFSTAICFLGLAAAWGGINLKRFGPRKLAMTGGALFGIGYLVAALALQSHSLMLFYFGYGVIGGVGLGLGYVTPVATAAKWFPDRKGLVTGMVVMGFGFGALLMSKVLAPTLIAWTGGNYVHVFGAMGVLFLVATIFVAFFLVNPPAGWAPKGYSPAAAASAAAQDADGSLTARSCLLSGRFVMMWLVFFCNIAAGIAIINFQSPLMQELWKNSNTVAAAATLMSIGATLTAVSSLFNGAGRFLWGGASDKIGRVQAFRIMLGTQIVAFAGMIWMTQTGSPWVFGALVCYVLLCYGGGFGTMPSFVTDVFGPRMMSVVYGVILTAWAAAGVAGPQIFAKVKDLYPPAQYGNTAAIYSFIVAGGFLLAGLVMSLFLNNKRFTAQTSNG